jgi:hypothetical protein
MFLHHTAYYFLPSRQPLLFLDAVNSLFSQIGCDHGIGSLKCQSPLAQRPLDAYQSVIFFSVPPDKPRPSQLQCAAAKSPVFLGRYPAESPLLFLAVTPQPATVTESILACLRFMLV